MVHLLCNRECRIQVSLKSEIKVFRDYTPSGDSFAKRNSDEIAPTRRGRQVTFVRTKVQLAWKILQWCGRSPRGILFRKETSESGFPKNCATSNFHFPISFFRLSGFPDVSNIWYKLSLVSMSLRSYYWQIRNADCKGILAIHIEFIVSPRLTYSTALEHMICESWRWQIFCSLCVGYLL